MGSQDEEAITNNEKTGESETALPRHVVQRAVKCSYIQAMLGTVYISLCGGMFVIGYAIKLGANNVQIGLLTSLPMFCVLVQLLSSVLVERGISRRRLTITWMIMSIVCWMFVIPLPHIELSRYLRIIVFLTIIGSSAAFSHMTNNTRSSWIGDLIPERERGHFFGKIMFFSGIIGALFAVIGGRFLDHTKNMGLAGFNYVFGVGMLFGLLTAIFYIPQSDVPIVPHEHGDDHLKLVKETLKNRPLMMVTAFAIVFSLQSIAGPFVTTYLIRDLKMPYAGLGVLVGIATVMTLLTSPFWGRVVDRYGCRPVLIATTMALTPVSLVWIWTTTVHRAYMIIGPANLLVGFIGSGISVALSTLIFKVTTPAGRSMQLAIYSIIVVLIAAPMPWIGGHVPGWIQSLGIKTDIRCVFYISILILGASSLVARKIEEPNSLGTREMVMELPSNIRKQEAEEANGETGR